MTSLPIAGDQVFAAVERLHRNLDAVKQILTDEQTSSVRLVVNPEKMVISEARRTYTYLGLFGYRVDAVVEPHPARRGQRPALWQVEGHPGRAPRHGARVLRPGADPRVPSVRSRDGRGASAARDGPRGLRSATSPPCSTTTTRSGREARRGVHPVDAAAVVSATTWTSTAAARNCTCGSAVQAQPDPAPDPEASGRARGELRRRPPGDPVRSSSRRDRAGATSGS